MSFFFTFDLVISYRFFFLRRLDRHHLRKTQESSQYEMLRPGFSRLNLAYFLDDEQVDYVIEAVKLVAEHAWRLLPFYKFNPETAEWRHGSESVRTVKAPNFLPHGNFPYFLGRSVAPPGGFSHKMNKTNSADPNDFSNFQSHYFSVGHVLITNALKQEWKFSTRWKVGDFESWGRLR